MRRKTIVVAALLIAACAVSVWADEIVFGFRPVPPCVMVDAAGWFSSTRSSWRPSRRRATR